MFFDKRLLIGLVIYIIASVGLSISGILSERVIIYVEELKNMGIFDFMKSFYINIIETYSHVTQSDDTKSSSSMGLLLFILKIFITGALLNFTFSSINKGVSVMLLSYIILTPVFLYFTSLYFIEYDYVAFHANSLLFFISYVIGFAFVMTFFDRSKYKLETSDLVLTIVGFILIYTYGEDEFQSALFITSVAVMCLGAVIAFVSGFLIKNKPVESSEPEPEPIQ